MVEASLSRTSAQSSAIGPWDAACPSSPDGRHKPKVAGYHSGPRPGIECEKPLAVRCLHCRADTTWQCQNHRESRCKPCSGRYRRRLHRIADAGMKKREHTGQMGMLTLTAPSPEDHRRWVPGGRAGSSCTSCPRHMADGLGRWNAGSAGHWNRLRTALVRQYPDLVFLRAVEPQKRGALHLHVIVWVPSGWDVATVQALATGAGFGCVLDWAECEPGSRRAAYYVSKYVTKATDQREECPWVVDEVERDADGYTTGEAVARTVPARYRTWSSSRAWGLTMRQIKDACRASAAARAARARADADGAPGGVGAGADGAPARSAASPEAPPEPAPPPP